MSVTQINVYVADRAAADRIVSTSEDGGVTVDGAAVGDRTGDENPFKGLDAFDEADAERFYGRTTITDRLRHALGDLTAAGADAPRLLPILGPSGSGKSSIARAGLIPALARRPLDGLRNPRIVYLTPRANPLAELALVLARIEPGERHPATVAAEFERLLRQPDPDGSGRLTGLRRIADSLTQAGERALVILVDQFEELFVLTGSEDERRMFIDGLLEAAGDPGGRVSAILTMRSDFLGATMSHRGLNALIAAHGVIVPTMTDSELRETIEAPAIAAGRPLPPGVVDRLVDETEDRAGALPLLQFALSRIWDGMVAGQEAGETLRAIGGVGGALAGRAEALFQELDPAERAVAKRAFLATVSLGEGARDTRRRARLAEIVPADADPAAVKDVVAGFARKHERLMTIAGTGDEITIEVTHEAIFDHWTRFDDWLAQEREDLRFQRRLSDAATSWDTAEPPRPSGGLWRHPALDRLAEYHAQHKAEMTAIQLEFFEAGRRHDRWSRLFRLGGVAATLLAIVAGGFGWYAWEQRNAARLAADRAERIQSSFLADMARQQTAAGDATLGALLAVEALKDGREVVPEAEAALLESLVEMREVFATTVEGPVHSVSIGANGRYALVEQVGGTDVNPVPHSPILIDIVDRAVVPMPAGVGSRIGMALHPTEPLLAAPDDDGVALFHLDSAAAATLAIPSDSGPWTLEYRIHISEDGRFLAAISRAKGHFWELANDRYMGEQEIMWTSQSFPEASFRGERILISQGYATAVFELRTLQPVHESMARGVRGGSLSPDGQFLMEFWSSPRFLNLGGGSAEPEWFSARALGEPERSQRPFGQDDDFSLEAAFSPDGTALITSGTDGTVNWYPLEFNMSSGLVLVDSPVPLAPDPDLVQRAIEERANSELRVRDGARNGATAYAISPDGRHIAVGGFYGQIGIWALQGGGPPYRVAVLSAHGAGNAVTHLGYSAGGDKLISAGGNGSVRIWTLRPPGAHAIGNPYGERVRAFTAPNGDEVVLRDTLQGEDFWQVSAIAVSPDGRLAVTGGSVDGNMDLWDATTGSHLARLEGQSNWVHRARFTADGARLMTSGEDGYIRLWDVASREVSVRFGADGIPGVEFSAPWDAVLSPDETEVLAFGETEAIGIWGLDGMLMHHIDLANHQQIGGLEVEILDVGYLDEHPVAIVRTGNDDASYVLWDVRRDRSVQDLRAADGRGRAFDFVSAISRDIVAFAHVDGTISLWQRLEQGGERPPTLDLIGELPGHPGSRIRALSFSADRRRLASMASDGHVMLWDPDRLAQVGNIAGTGGVGRTVALSADGAVTIAGFDWSSDAKVPERLMIWRTPVGRDALVTDAEARSARDLTLTERLNFYVELR